jgi:glutaredoxin 3
MGNTPIIGLQEILAQQAALFKEIASPPFDPTRSVLYSFDINHTQEHSGGITMKKPVSILIFLFTALFALTGLANETVVGPQSTVKPASEQAKKYPRIVLYSVSWCPHCKAAKEYLTSHNIPFINKDVELDDQAMKDLTEKYDSKGVPVFVIGNDEKVIKGFNQEKFEKILKQMTR